MLRNKQVVVKLNNGPNLARSSQRNEWSTLFRTFSYLETNLYHKCDPNLCDRTWVTSTFGIVSGRLGLSGDLVMCTIYIRMLFNPILGQFALRCYKFAPQTKHEMVHAIVRLLLLSNLDQLNLSNI